ncbi:MAG: RNase adapter RapZ [Pseudomonadota bacterium]|nr:RNase adapter RapZ [Pseudomonadota bacterium]
MTDKEQTSDGNADLEPNAAGAPFRVLLVTGMSGAGKTAALKALEDLGYEAVDNLPLSLVGALVAPAARSGHPIAIGIDIRTRDFGIAQFLHEIDELIGNGNYDARILFLDCEDEILLRRFTETRRRHPLALDRPVADGIRHERRLVSELRDRADLLIDTSSLILGDLKRVLHGHFALDASPGIAVFVTSFSYRRGLPPEADMVFDARFLANPHYIADLRDLTGLDPAVGDYVAADEGFDVYFESVTTMLGSLLPRFSQEGKSYLTIAVGCTGGRHRSVYVAEKIAAWLCNTGGQAGISHRDLLGA